LARVTAAHDPLPSLLMTHEYVIGLRGVVLGGAATADGLPTALAWAADRVLAVGSDEAVRAIRGATPCSWTSPGAR
jgi:hypothetical protein